MIVTTQPPPTVRVGYPIYLTCTVQSSLRYYDGSYEDVGRLFAVATVVAASASGPGIPIATNMYDPSPPQSVSWLSEDEEDDDGHVIGRVSFPSVVVRQAGAYHVRVTLVRSALPGELSVNLQAVDSDAVSIL